MYRTKQSPALRRPVSSANTASETRTKLLSLKAVINLDHGDPAVFESYWRNAGERCTVTIAGHQSLSYFADPKNLCWFLEPKLEEEIRRLHDVVGNAKSDGHHIVVGTGSSQLIQAALYALSPLDEPKPISVVAAAPYYSGVSRLIEIVSFMARESCGNAATICIRGPNLVANCLQCYPEVTDFLRSRLYKWAGDARKFDKDAPYIELVTSPNNPNGVMQEPVVNKAQGRIIHDLAYYWPQYTPIANQLNFDIMLFSVSKCTGHAGSRIGWALVRDKDVAKRMTKFMEISTIGVSKESQLRAAKIMGVIADSCKHVDSPFLENFFDYGQQLMAIRWERLREVVKQNEFFSLPKYPLQYCHFTGEFTEAHPAFAWMSCKSIDGDLEKILGGHKILTRGGRRFGSDSKYARVNMMCREEEFNLFIQRLSTIQEITNGN